MGKRARRRQREWEELRERRWTPILTPVEQRRVDRARAEMEANGYRLEWVEWCESAEAPGWLGEKAGITLQHVQVVRVRTPGMTGAQVVAIVEHELEHVLGADWATDHEHLGLRCGGRRNGWGELVCPPRNLPEPVDGGALRE